MLRYGGKSFTRRTINGVELAHQTLCSDGGIPVASLLRRPIWLSGSTLRFLFVDLRMCVCVCVSVSVCVRTWAWWNESKISIEWNKNLYLCIYQYNYHINARQWLLLVQVQWFFFLCWNQEKSINATMPSPRWSEATTRNSYTIPTIKWSSSAALIR